MKQIVFYLQLSLIATQGFADNVTLPHTFSPGEIVSSSKVNQNFQSLEVGVNKRIIGVDAVVMFLTLSLYEGNLGGRNGADEKCNNDKIMMFVHQLRPFCYARAFMSFSENDQTKDFSENFNIPNDKLTIAPSKAVLGEKFNDIVKTPYGFFYSYKIDFLVGVLEAIPLHGYTLHWMTGSNNIGEFDNACEGFTSNAQTKVARGTGSNIHGGGNISYCNSPERIMCVCY